MNQESKRRLLQAYKADKYILEIQDAITKILSYTAMPFNNEVPNDIKVCQEMIKHYTALQYPGLFQELSHRYDLVTAMGSSIMAHNNVKILSTKQRSNRSVLECIDNRLDLFPIYLRYKLDHTDWYRGSIFDTYVKLGFIFTADLPVMNFDQWLYRKGYEFLLTDNEFLNVINKFDHDYRN